MGTFSFFIYTYFPLSFFHNFSLFLCSTPSISLTLVDMFHMRPVVGLVCVYNQLMAVQSNQCDCEGRREGEEQRQEGGEGAECGV